MFRHLRKIFLILALILFAIELNAQQIKTEIDVFPNPLKDVVTLEIKDAPSQPTEMAIFNIIGKKIYSRKIIGLESKGKLEIDLSELNPGVYFLNIISQKETLATQKIVKKG